MTDLITRIEQADGPRRELFDEAAKLFWGLSAKGVDPDFWLARWVRFNRMIDAEAWTSVAEMLVPDDLDFEVRRKFAHLFNRTGKRRDYETYATHPSLALLAAILRAERNEP